MTIQAPANTAESVPLACVPGAIPAIARAAHRALLTRLFATAARERRELPDGYAYRFEAAALEDLARWIANERRCCSFLTFTLDLAPDDGPIWLRVAGPAGTRALLDAEIPTLHHRGTPS